MTGVELLLSASLTIAIDQLSKKIVMCRVMQGKISSKGLLVRSRLVTNARVRQRWLRNRLVLLFLFGFTVLSIVLLVHYGPFFQSHIAQVGLGAALGGATGNLCDMLWRRAVVDFIDVGFWPVFNIADVTIVLGVAVALWFAV